MDGYHEGSGSLECRLATREPSERVSWTRRWRDCSRALIWSGVGVVILRSFLFLLSWNCCWWCEVVERRSAASEVDLHCDEMQTE